MPDAGAELNNQAPANTVLVSVEEGKGEATWGKLYLNETKKALAVSASLPVNWHKLGICAVSLFIG